MGIDPGRLDRAGWSDLIKHIKGLPRGIAHPKRRAEARDAPAFLIDRDQQPFAPVDRTQIVSQGAQLIGPFAIAPEQDVARRVCLTEKGALVRRQSSARKAEDRWNHDEDKFAPQPGSSKGTRG